MTVVIPAYRPDFHLADLIRDIRKAADFKIIVVDDGSCDGGDADIYGQFFESISKSVILLRHSTNKGKGAAIKTSLAYIKDNMPDDEGIVIIDADGQHNVDDMLKVCETLVENPAGLVLGIRSFDIKIPLRSKIGNIITKYVFYFASGVKLSDTQTGLRAFKADMIPVLMECKGDRYEFEMEMLLECAIHGIKITEVPIRTIYTDKYNSSSHFHLIRDSFCIYLSIIKFAASSIISFAADYTLFMLFSYISAGMTEFSNISARLISSMLNFYLNKKFVFKSRDNILYALARYFALVLTILFLNTLLLAFLSNLLPDWAAKLVTEFILLAFNMTTRKVFVYFQKTRKKVKQKE